MLNEKQLKDIRENLPKDGYRRIADRTGYTTSMVGRVLRETKHYNTTIIYAALAVIEEYNCEKQKQEKELKEKLRILTQKPVRLDQTAP